MIEDTIAAVATPTGSGGLGVVRVSGPTAIAVAAGLWSGTDLSLAASHTLHHGTVRDGGETIDEAVAGVFRAPRSYTGEDVVEFSCHGGVQVLKRVLESCLRQGARPADPGEFTRRAFLNGKMDLAQAEAVADLISARSESQRRLALGALRGELTRRLAPAREHTLSLLAHVDASLDFVDDEIPLLQRDSLISRLDSAVGALDGLLASSVRGRVWRDGVRVALAGRPNAGKSSLFNSLLAMDRAIVADLPGTTRDTLEESVVWDDILIALVDTAGLRETPDGVEKEGNRRAREALARADVVIYAVDSTLAPTEDDHIQFRSLENKTAVVALNKSDDPSSHRWAPAWRTEVFPGFPTAIVSARTGLGLDLLKKTVLSLAGTGVEPEEPPFVFNVRQFQMVREARSALDRARNRVRDGAPDETVAIDLKEALGTLNAVTGKGAPEEVLDAVFSTFCVGK